MHHSLRLYGQHQHRLIHLYISLARLTRIPVIGSIVRWVANTYAVHGHSGYLLTLPEAEQIVDIASSISLGPCSCRQEFHKCNYPVMSEIVLESGSKEVYASRCKEFKAISKEEAKEVLRQAHRNHLTHSIMHCGGHYYALCNCCPCCCVPTRLLKQFGIGKALVRNPRVTEDFRDQQL
ncbi:MAG: ferredoxin-like protein [Dehalococcoidales bacterium]|nr:ferredoxin-like protein [Dehalococcoidales bacterium]